MAVVLSLAFATGAKHMMSKEQNDFIYVVRVHAKRSQAETQVPPSVTLAQAILESAWGKSRLTRDANSLFGIKADGWKGKRYGINSDEIINGRRVSVYSQFRAYDNWGESIMDHGRFLRKPWYASAFQFTHDPYNFAMAIARCGYATDPLYAYKLKQLMDQYDLYRWDN